MWALGVRSTRLGSAVGRIADFGTNQPCGSLADQRALALGPPAGPSGHSNNRIATAASGRSWPRAGMHVVVTNAKYTRQAQALATKTRVFLLHVADLSDLAEILRSRPGGTGARTERHSQ